MYQFSAVSRGDLSLPLNDLHCEGTRRSPTARCRIRWYSATVISELIIVLYSSVLAIVPQENFPLRTHAFLMDFELLPSLALNVRNALKLHTHSEAIFMPVDLRVLLSARLLKRR